MACLHPNMTNTAVFLKMSELAFVLTVGAAPPSLSSNNPNFSVRQRCQQTNKRVPLHGCQASHCCLIAMFTCHFRHSSLPVIERAQPGGHVAFICPDDTHLVSSVFVSFSEIPVYMFYRFLKDLQKDKP